MARRRGQNTGHLYKKGPSWMLEWREYIRDGETGVVKPVRRAQVIAAAEGPDKVGKREAEKIARDEYIAKANEKAIRPGTSMTVAQFVERQFIPNYVFSLKTGGRVHYEYVLKHVVSALGHRRLGDVEMFDVQNLVKEKIDEGYSVQTALHIRTVIHTLYEFARRSKMFSGDNPSIGVRLPEVTAAPLTPGLTPAQARTLVPRLPSPCREMAVLSIATSMNVAEICGLRQKRVNLTDQFVIVDGEPLPPFSLFVRENFYRNEYGSTKTGSRRRTIGLPSMVVEMLREVIGSIPSQFTGPEYPVFVSRNGTPVDQHNLSSRHLRPLARKLLGVKSFGWHAFRRAHSTVADIVQMPLTDRQKLMGHGRDSMTLHYAQADVDRRREGSEKILQAVFFEGQKGGPVQ